MKNVIFIVIPFMLGMNLPKLIVAQTCLIDYEIPSGEGLDEFRRLARLYPKVDSLGWENVIFQLREALYRLEDHGYPAAQLQIGRQSTSGYQIKLEPGPFLILGNFRFNGARSRIYPRVFSALLNQPYSWSSIQKRLQYLNRYAFIQSIRFDSLVWNSQTVQSIAVFKVEEKKRTDLQSLLSYQDNHWLGFIRFKQLDFLSRAAELSLNYEQLRSGLSQIQSSFNYLFPFDLPIETEVALQQERKEEQYQRLKVSLALSYLNPLSFWRIELQSGGEWMNLDKEWQQGHSAYDHVEATIRLWRDTYVNPFQMSGGMKWQLAYQVKRFQSRDESFNAEQIDVRSQYMIPLLSWFGLEWKAQWTGYTRKNRSLDEYYLIPIGGSEWMKAYPANFIWAWQTGYGYLESFFRIGNSTRWGLWYEKIYFTDSFYQSRSKEDWGISMVLPVKQPDRWMQIILALPGRVNFDEMVLYVKMVY